MLTNQQLDSLHLPKTYRVLLDLVLNKAQYNTIKRLKK
jgi:hypothetical protein